MSQKNARKALFSVASIWLAMALVFEFQAFREHKSEVQEASKSSPNPMGHIQYFGYYGSAMNGLDDATEATSDHANLTWIAYGDVNYVVSKLKEAQWLGMKAIVDLQLTFFDGNGNLLPNFQQNWQQMAEALAPYEGSIAAFYPMDEPYGNARDQKVAIKTRLQQLNIVGATLKSTFPAIPLAVIFDITSLKKKDPLPNFDWFGVDCYKNFNNCGGYSMGSYYFSLAARLHYGQNLIVVPWAFSAPDYPTDEEALLDQAKNYYNLAQRFPTVIAVVPFIYQSFVGVDKVPMTGVQSMPKLRQAWVSIAHQISPPRFIPVKPETPAIGSNVDDEPSTPAKNTSSAANIRSRAVGASCGRVGNSGRVFECQ